MNVRDTLQQLNSNTFIIELVSVNRDLGVVDTELNLPAGQPSRATARNLCATGLA